MIYIFFLLNLFILISGTLVFGLIYFPIILQENPQLSEILKSLYYSFRFNLQATSYLTLIFLLFYPFLKLLKIRKIGILVFLNITLFVQLSNISFYYYFNDNLNSLIFGLIEDDFAAILISIYKNFPVFIFLFLFLIANLIFFRVISFYTKKFPQLLGKSKVISALSIFIILLLGRGSIGTFPLSPNRVSFTHSKILNDLSLNGFTNLHTAIKQRIDSKRTRNYLSRYQYKDMDQVIQKLNFKTDKYFHQDLISPQFSVKHNKKKNLPNLIFILNESFGQTLMNFDSPKFPILGKLSDHLKNKTCQAKNTFVSSDNGTIGSLLSLLLGLPIRPGSPQVSVTHAHTFLPHSPHLLFKKLGYEPIFIYGGNKNWRNLNQFLKTQKFSSIFGMSDINKKLKLKNSQSTEWGVFDQYLYDFILKYLEEQKAKQSSRPKLIIALSTSNHPPFELPANYSFPDFNLPAELKKRIIREDDLFEKRLKSFYYSNNEIGTFLQRINTKNNFTFITGDHNFWGNINYEKSDLLDKHSVPFITCNSNNQNRHAIDKIAPLSHAQILPSVLENLFSTHITQNQSYQIFKALTNSRHFKYGLNSKVIALSNGDFIQVPKRIRKSNHNLREFFVPIIFSDYYLKEILKAK